MDRTPEYVTIAEASQIVGVVEDTIEGWMRTGKLAYLRTVGGGVRIHRSALWQTTEPPARKRFTPTRRPEFDEWKPCAFCGSIPQRIVTCCECNGTKVVGLEHVLHSVWSRPQCPCEACAYIRAIELAMDAGMIR